MGKDPIGIAVTQSEYVTQNDRALGKCESKKYAINMAVRSRAIDALLGVAYSE